MKIVAVKLSEGYVDEESLPEISRFSSAEELNQFLKQDDEEAVALRVKLFDLVLAYLSEDGDAYATAIEMFDD